MFNIASAQKSGELDKISYSIAEKRKPKKGVAFWITPVSWDGAPIEYMDLELKTVGVVQFVKPPHLPAGYKIEFHESWHDLFKLIYSSEDCQKYSFEDLDRIVSDWYTIEDQTGHAYGDCPIWSDRRDYLKWSTSFDDEWCNLDDRIKALTEQAISPQKQPHSSENNGIGNREYPPPLRDVLMKMVELLDSGEFVEPELDDRDD